MFHINDNDEAKPCSAKQPENCKFYNGERDARHYEDLHVAVKASETLLAERHGSVNQISKYSFVRDFKAKEVEFERDFEGFPTRFFNADLEGKVFPPALKLMTAEEMDEFVLRMFNTPAVTARMFNVTSAPADMKAPTEEVQKTLEDLGADKVSEITELSVLRSIGTSKAWLADFGSEQIVIVGEKKGSNMESYSFKRKIDDMFNKNSFRMTDVKTVMGAYRTERKTGITLFKDIVSSDPRKLPVETRRNVVKTMEALREAQIEGKNFKAQKSYIKDHSGTTATAWMDKKNPDKLRQEMMKTTNLNKVFRKVEIDNDVDPVEYANFERSYHEIADKLPAIPNDRKPELRIRKLGKHNANGIYFPHSNTICVDVRDSSAFVHEYAHYADMAVKSNASLSNEFREFSKAYSKDLTMPDNYSGRGKEYFTTPTEIHSRLFEVYANERLGIDNKLLNPENFSRFDYQPIMNNPEMKEKAFAFFDRIYKK